MYDHKVVARACTCTHLTCMHLTCIHRGLGPTVGVYPCVYCWLTLSACAAGLWWSFRVSVCSSLTKLAATYLVCESKVQCYNVPYGVQNAWIVWISLSVLASFADFKLVDFPELATFRMNKTCITCYIQYIRIIDPLRVCIKHSLVTAAVFLAQSTGELSMTMGWQWLLFNFNCKGMTLCI